MCVYVGMNAHMGVCAHGGVCVYMGLNIHMGICEGAYLGVEGGAFVTPFSDSPTLNPENKFWKKNQELIVADY
jgi:hypothetical protein